MRSPYVFVARSPAFDGLCPRTPKRKLDLVILCRRGRAEEALHQLREIMGRLKLTVNEEKTRICKLPEGEFDFLGYTFGRMYSPKTGQARLGHQAVGSLPNRSLPQLEPVSGAPKTEIGKSPAETRAAKPSIQDRKS